MSDTKPNRTIQIVIALGIMLIFFFIAVIIGHEPTLGTEEAVTVGRYQIVSEPSGIVMRIDTHDGVTDRLVRDEPTGRYIWERIQ